MKFENARIVRYHQNSTASLSQMGTETKLRVIFIFVRLCVFAPRPE
jgi:hypothetical protein